MLIYCTEELGPLAGSRFEDTKTCPSNKSSKGRTKAGKQETESSRINIGGGRANQTE